MPNKVESKEEILKRMRSSKEQIKALGVQRIGLFGSFVTRLAPKKFIDHWSLGI